MEYQNVQAVTALRLFAFDKQHNSSPANSLDFGFREAMSSFKNSPQSAVDLRRLNPELAASADRLSDHSLPHSDKPSL